jgi:hypothetical protein
MGTKLSSSKSPLGDNSPSSLSTFEILCDAAGSLNRRPLLPSLVPPPFKDVPGLPVSPPCQGEQKHMSMLLDAIHWEKD